MEEFPALGIDELKVENQRSQTIYITSCGISSTPEAFASLQNSA